MSDELDYLALLDRVIALYQRAHACAMRPDALDALADLVTLAARYAGASRTIPTKAEGDSVTDKTRSDQRGTA